MNMMIKDLVWEYSKDYSNAASRGDECYYLVRKDDNDDYYSAICIDVLSEFNHVSLCLGYGTAIDIVCALCNTHHKERVAGRYLER